MSQPKGADSSRKTGSTVGRLAVLVLLGLGVALIVLLLLAVRYRAASSVANLAGWLPVGYAFGAGMVASVNPCGFFLLPSYVSYQLGTEEQGFYTQAAPARLLRALLIAGVATAGFIAIFSLFGYVIALGGFWLVKVFPYAGFAIGVGLALLGAWLLVSHASLGVAAAGRVGVTPKKNLRNVFLFGAGYAVCSLSCTLPVFLVVVGSALASKGFVESFSQFISYSMGMGLVLVAVTVGAALFKGAVARVLKRAQPYVHVVSALFLIAAGLYVTYYWLHDGQLF